MVKPALKHTLEALLVLIGVVVVLAAAFSLRLASGPIAMPGLRPFVEHTLAKQVEGGRAKVGEATLVWFPDTKALGVRLGNVSLTDGKGRPVLRAAAVEGAVALDSALLFAPAPGRLTASDFFAAVSVSPQGRYGLGYETSGSPERVGGLDRMFVDLIGEAKRGRSASFLRDMNLSRGSLAFREAAGPVAWTSRIDRIVFHKGDGRILGDCSLVIDDGQRRSTLNVHARAAVGLKDARLTGEMTNLTPARIFPAVGASRVLSALDAQVQGHGTLAYAASKGVTAADVVFTAGAGRLRFGRAYQRFDSAEVSGGYDPRSGEVKLTRFKVAAERTRLDVQGSLKLIPEQGRRQPAHVTFQLRGPDGLVTLAPSAAPQPVQDLYVRGDYVPETGRLALDEARVRVAGAPVSGKAVFQRGKKDGQAWGIQANARIGGSIGPEQLFAFWPEGMAEGARSWLKPALLAGRVHDVKVMANIAPGDLNRDRLDNKALRIDFTGDALKLMILQDLPPLEDAVGHGVLQGNRLDIAMPTGRIQKVALSEGSVEIPFMKPKGAKAIFKARAIGEAREIVQIVDTPKMHLVSGAGFNPMRLSGQADVRLEMTRPLLKDVPLKDYLIRYYGQVKQAGVKQAAIGLDMHDGDVMVEGSAHALNVKGTGLAGPYHGNIEFNADFTGKAGISVDLDGALDVAGAAAGAFDSGAPFKARFEVNHGEGAGVIHSRPLEGKVTWVNDRRVVLEGVSQPAGWREAGVPMAAGVGKSFPLKLTLNKAGAGWNGVLEADAYSGSVAWTPGSDKPHLRYVADLTPEEAKRLGLGIGGVFSKTQAVSADVVLDPDGSANYALGPMTGRVDWTMKGGQTQWRWRATLSRADLTAMGAPSFIQPTASVPVDATLVAANGGIAGDVTAAGADFKVAMISGEGGRRQVNITGAPSDAALERLGLLPQGGANGIAGLAARFDRLGDGSWTGHVSADLTRMALAIPDTDWRKSAGKRAMASLDFTARPDGIIVFDRIIADGAGLDIRAQGSAAKGKLMLLATTRPAKVDSVYEGAFRASREANGALVIRANGRFADARPIIKRLSQRPATVKGPVGGGGEPEDPWRVEGQFAEVRVTDVGVLHNVKIAGQTGKLDVTAATGGGSGLSLRLYPEGGGTAFTAKIADVAQAGEAFFGDMPLRGGTAVATGKLAPGGFDAVVEMQNVHAVRVPAMGQLLTMASLKGLADTMNGDGILFTKVLAPIRVRGAMVYLDDTRASGSALGITAKGSIDLDDRTMDLSGALAPAYALNSLMSNVPVLGSLLTSRKGEGVFGLTYTARGAVKTPKVMVNPLSLATPGILRRIFEPVRKPKGEAAAAGGPGAP